VRGFEFDIYSPDVDLARVWRNPTFFSMHEQVPSDTLVGRPTNCVTGQRSTFIGMSIEQEDMSMDQNTVGENTEDISESTTSNNSSYARRGKKYKTPSSPSRRSCLREGVLSAGGGRTEEDLSVEELAMQHFCVTEGMDGVHSEGGFLRTLYGILLFDVIFDPLVSDAFWSRFQTAPLDLRSSHFYIRRKARVDARIASFEAEGNKGHAAMEDIVRHIWRFHFGVSASCIQWDLLDLDAFVAVMRGIPVRAIKFLLTLFASDLRNWSSGLPDLLLWKRHTPATSATPASDLTEGLFQDSKQQDNTHLHTHVKFVEVKGPNDRLSSTQKTWLALLSCLGVDVAVLHVKPPERIGKNKRKKDAP
jgi:hypothetical protein